MKADEILNLLTGKARQQWERRFGELLEAGLTEDQAATWAFREQADVEEGEAAQAGDRPGSR